VLLVLGLIALIAPSFVHLNRFAQQLAATLSATLGRDVTVEKVWLQLLPRPGFKIKNLTIADDSGFGAEPMIRSEEVIASLRIPSVWRGRLEIASLTLKEPSLNLVRDRSGRWNVEALLERAARTPSAPTAKVQAEVRPRFPYIEAEDGRVNIKFEQEKKVYAMSATDFSLWLASEDEWNMRLAGRPIRSDANLSNTGKLKAEGSFKRAADLRATPIKLEVKLEDAQLGQLTHLIYGFDRGWRGATNLSATFHGTPADFTLSTDARVAGFRRYDIARTDNLTLQNHCDAHYRAVAPTNDFVHARNFFLNVQCNSPVQDGQLVLHAELSPAESQPLVEVIAVSIPLSSVAAFARHAKKGVAEDLNATGTISGNLEWRQGELGGSWVASAVRLKSDALTAPVTLGDLIFSVQRDLISTGTKSSGDTLVRLLPFSVPLGAPAPLTVQGSFSRSDYHLGVNGMADGTRLAALFKALGLPMPVGVIPEATGLGKVELEVDGPWAGFAAPKAAGIVRPQSASVARAGIK
jgi:hypothetical protein